MYNIIKHSLQVMEMEQKNKNTRKHRDIAYRIISLGESIGSLSEIISLENPKIQTYKKIAEIYLNATMTILENESELFKGMKEEAIQVATDRLAQEGLSFVDIFSEDFEMPNKNVDRYLKIFTKRMGVLCKALIAINYENIKYNKDDINYHLLITSTAIKIAKDAGNFFDELNGRDIDLRNLIEEILTERTREIKKNI